MGNWHHIYAPTKGMVTDRPSTLLDKEASPWIKGMYLKDGVINSDFGHTDYPVPGNTTANHLDGKMMYIDQFYKTNGSSWLLAFTTTNIYSYNTSTTTWDCALLERKPLEDELAAMEIPDEQRLGIINVEYMNLSNMVKAVDDIEEEKSKKKPWENIKM